MGSWNVLDLSELQSEDESSRLAYLRRFQKNPDDYVSIRLGFTHVAYAHNECQGASIAMASELSEIPQEQFNVYSLRTEDQRTGVGIKYFSRDLNCFCCIKRKKEKNDKV